MTREPKDQPFASTSVWNTPIGSAAQWSNPASHSGNAQLITLRGAVNGSNWSQPHYIGSASDPLVTVTCSDNTYPIASQQIHIPKNATPALPSNGDRHMAFFDLTQPNKMWSYFYCYFKNGVDVTGGITSALGGIYDVCGDGINTIGNTGRPASKTGTSGDYNFAIGTIRDWELRAGVIQHTLRYSCSDNAIKAPGSDWITNIPWPDHHSDYIVQNYTGQLLYGSTIGIPGNVDLTHLGLSQGGLILAKALQQYGAIMRDAGGTTQVTFYAEPISDSNANATLLNQMRNDMGKIVPQLRVLLNQGPSSVNGGGVPLIALPPPLNPTICPGQPTPTPTPAFKVSSINTVVPTSLIIDTLGNQWSIIDAQVAMNLTPDTSTGNVIKLAWANAPGTTTPAIWHENAQGGWWYKLTPTSAWSPPAGLTVSPV